MGSYFSSNGGKKILTNSSKAVPRMFGLQIRYANFMTTLLMWTNMYCTLQTVSNACASVALLNIINNNADIELGEHLQHFKAFTTGLAPALRGDAISNFTFVKEIHNSYARFVKVHPLDVSI